jgi:enoyl-CoA hydratase
LFDHLVGAGEERRRDDEAERIARKPLFALKLVKQAVNAAQDTQGRVSAMQTSFALHHLAHAHNILVHGKLIDPSGVMSAVKKS